MTERGLRLTALALAVLGSVVSAYLTWIHYSGQLALCLGAGGCETVQASQYAELAGAPVALLGLIALAAATAIAAMRLWADAPAWTLTAQFGIGLAGTLFVAYLMYLQLFVIHAICPWCVLADSSMVALFVVTLLELRAAPSGA